MSEKLVLKIEYTLKKIIWLHIKRILPNLKKPIPRLIAWKKKTIREVGFRTFVADEEHFRLDFELDRRIRGVLGLKKIEWCILSGKFPKKNPSHYYSGSPVK